MVLRYLIIILGVTISLSAQCQKIKLSYKVGGNLNRVRHNYVGRDNPDSKPNFGLNTGVSVYFNLNNPGAYFETGIGYSSKGFTTVYNNQSEFYNGRIQSKTNGTSEFKLGYIEIPLMFHLGRKKIKFHTGFYIGIFTDGYLKNNITIDHYERGHYTSENTKKYNIYSFKKNENNLIQNAIYVPSLDFGGNIGISYELKRICFEINYAAGFVNLNPSSISNQEKYKDYNRVLSINFKYYIFKH